MQSPTPYIVSQLSPVAHFPVPAPEQTRAQYFFPSGVWRRHIGPAVSPEGVSDGQLVPEHSGKHESPASP